MRDAALVRLACPACGGSLAAEVTDRWSQGAAGEEARGGSLRCARCASSFEVLDGMVDFLPRTLSHVVAEEVEANRAYAEHERAGCDDAWLLALPASHALLRPLMAEHDETADFEDIARLIPADTHPRLLDLGAGTCWTAAAFAARGHEVDANDVSFEKYVGLRSAEPFLRERGQYFERLRFDMNQRWPYADGALDAVVGISCVHHAETLLSVFREAARVLRPGGVFAVVEVTRSVVVPERLTNFGADERAGGHHAHERIYTRLDWARAARGAGFQWQARSAGSYRAKLRMIVEGTGLQSRRGMKARLARIAAPVLRSSLGRAFFEQGPGFAVANLLVGTQFIGVARKGRG